MDILICCCRSPTSKGLALGDGQDKSDAFKKAVKILLLGTGESGKSTILKQMKILHISGFSEGEKRDLVPVIRGNLHDSLCTILRDHRNALQIELGSECDAIALEVLRATDVERVTDRYVENIQQLLRTPNFQECLRRSNELQVMDNVEL